MSDQKLIGLKRAQMEMLFFYWHLEGFQDQAARPPVPHLGLGAQEQLDEVTPCQTDPRCLLMSVRSQEKA